jgi:1-acyl-sn-glycerol-3-phosphate acyltransferase
MLGRLTALLVKVLSERRLLFFTLFLSIVGLLLYGTRNLKIEEDIYSIFPANKEFRDFNDVLKKNNLNQQIVFTINVDSDEEQALKNLEEIHSELQSEFSSELKNFQVTRNINELELVQYLQEATILQLTDTDYEDISKKIKPDSLFFLLNKSFERLNETSGFFMRSLILKDPLGLLNKKLLQLNPMSDSSSYVVKDSYLYTKDEKTILFFATLNIDIKESQEISAFNSKLSEYRLSKNAKLGNNQFDYFGTFQIAAENAAQVKQDTTTTSLISIGLIALILIFYYRSLTAPFYFLLPALFGMLCGGGIVGWIHPEISAISLATSSVLLGIVLDYSFHFFTHFRQSSNIFATVNSITAPMIIGSFTTIAALASLMFTNSIVLQDFGLIALCVLSGSVVFTLIFLPVLIIIFGIKLPAAKTFFGNLKTSKWFVRICLLGSSILTGILFINNLNFSFDSDLTNLSFHSDELKNKEEGYTGINPTTDRKLYIIASSTNEETAKEINNKIFEITNLNKQKLEISELISAAPYLYSKKQITEANNKWVSFWSDKKDSLSIVIRQAAKSNNFSQSAFTPFENWLQDASLDSAKGINLANELGLSKMIYRNGQETSFITSVVLNKEKVQTYKDLLKNEEGVYIFDMSDLASTMLTSVQFDLNYLLLFSAFIVFISLIIVYGRIELAVFSFFPMVLGWIWTIGLANMFDIKFNFVNIVIATFIFGLGDDFSIFTTDGLIQKYRTGSDHSKSYRSAIILSGVTTIIGTGALFFAKHPAIHSIAVISVIGITSVMLITLVIQPLLFNILVTRRINKGRPPLTFFNLLHSLLLFLYFLTGSILLNIFLIFILLPFPASKRKKRGILNFIVSKLAKSTLYAGFHVKKQLINSDKLDFKKPSIIIANHSSFLDILLLIQLNPKVIIMVKSWVYKSPVFGLFIRYAGYPFIEEGVDSNIKFLRERVLEGYSIAIFPEGTRSKNGEIQRFHKGAFFLSKELDLEIQPILLIGAHEVNQKNDIAILKSNLILLPLERLSSNPKESYSAFAKRAQKLMRKSFAENKRKYAKVDFWQTLVLRNYLLKGPVLEWYVRIKWQLEKRNFEFYDDLIAERNRIFDIGCGYGYLSYYLHYRNTSRNILGIDYDSEKINTAQNGIKRNANLEFIESDIRHAKIDSADVLIFNDVLHYLEKDEQIDLLEKMIAILSVNGIILIRDGIVEMEKAHKATILTEIFSTRIFKFNKVANDLNFISENDLNNFSQKHNLTIEKIVQSKSTSNVLFIIRK